MKSTADLLRLIRDESNTLEAIARTLHVTTHHAAGLLDSVLGLSEFAESLAEWESDEWVRSEYRAGYDRGAVLLDLERDGEPVEVVIDVVPANPCPACDVPF